MTEPLIVDTDQLNSAGTILGKAAGTIPVELPKLSVPGTDPLSLAVAKGAAQVEAPMAALPGINADATTTAQNIRLAGQKYAETDRTQAEKAAELTFPKEQPRWPKGTLLERIANLGSGSFQWTDDDTKKALVTAPGEIATRTADAVGEKTLKALGAAGEEANKGLVTAFEKGHWIPGTPSLVGGPLKGLALAFDAVVNHADGDSWRKAAGKAAGSMATGAAIEPLAAAVGQMIIPIPGVGAAIGFAAGYVASEWADKFLDQNWETLADDVGVVKSAVGESISGVTRSLGAVAHGAASVFGFG